MIHMSVKGKYKKGVRYNGRIWRERKKLLLAGIGVAATTAEKSKEILDDMVEKGELTVEQGKALNEELKHNIKKTVKEKVNVSVKPSSPEEIDELLEKMTPEQLQSLKARIDAMNEAAEEKDKEDVQEASEEKEERTEAE